MRQHLLKRFAFHDPGQKTGVFLCAYTLSGKALCKQKEGIIIGGNLCGFFVCARSALDRVAAVKIKMGVFNMSIPERQFRFRHVQGQTFCVDWWDGHLWLFQESVTVPKKFLNGGEKTISVKNYTVRSGVLTKLTRW